MRDFEFRISLLVPGFSSATSSSESGISNLENSKFEILKFEILDSTLPRAHSVCDATVTRDP